MRWFFPAFANLYASTRSHRGSQADAVRVHRAVHHEKSLRGRVVVQGLDVTSGNMIEPQVSEGATTADHDIRHAPVSKAIYGVITVLAVLQVLEAHPPSAWSGAVFLFGTTVAVAMVDAYSESIAIMLAEERGLTLGDLRDIRHEVAPVLIGAQAPTGILLLSAIGLFSVERAISLAQVVAFLLLFSYGWRVGSMLHEQWLRRIASGLILVAIGAIAVGIKAAFH
jgi:hypothetical protein